MANVKTDRPAIATGRYLKYALGEIVLVVIGILIALSINNWNEERKSNEQLKGYLTTIKKNVQSDTVLIRRINRNYKYQHRTAQEYMRLVMKDSFSIDVLAESIVVLGEEYLAIDQSGFEALKSSGFLGKVQGTSIEDALFEYYGAYQDAHQQEISLNNFIEDMERRLFDIPKDDLIDALKLVDGQQYEGTTATKKPILEVAKSVFYNPHLLGVIQRYADEDSPRYDIMLTKANALLLLIDQELE